MKSRITVCILSLTIAILSLSLGGCSNDAEEREEKKPRVITGLSAENNSARIENVPPCSEKNLSESSAPNAPNTESILTESAENTYDNAYDQIPETTDQKTDDPDSYLCYNPASKSYSLTPEEEKIGKESLFVGDSICYGFSVWGVLPGENVYATECVAARNMLEYEMYYQHEAAEFIPVLKKVQPKHVFLWMGMNDVNMTSSEEYCKNYDKIISIALENSAADVYVCAITPINNLNFTKPAYIDEFNDAVERFIKKNYKERVHFINFGEPLKDQNGLLDDKNDGGDGIHLSQRAYYIAMHEIAKQMDKRADMP